MGGAVVQGAAVSAANQQAVAVSELEDLPLTGDYHGLGDIHTIPEAAPGEVQIINIAEQLYKVLL